MYTIINMSHPITPETKQAMDAKMKDTGVVVDLNIQLDLHKGIQEQVALPFNSAVTDTKGQIVVIPPAHSAAAYIIGRLAHDWNEMRFISMAWFVRDGSSMPPKFVLAGIE